MIALVATAATSAGCSHRGDDPDALLRRIIARNGIEALPTKPLVESPKYLLGEALFFDPVLSGQRDVACATCHRVDHATTDGLTISNIGRRADSNAGSPGCRAPRRNAPDLFNRDNNSVTSLFWDGRVEVRREGHVTVFRSPQGRYGPTDFENLLALQSLTPITTEEEMLGYPGTFSAQHLPIDHANRPNDLAVPSQEGEKRNNAPAVSDRLMNRLLGRGQHEPLEWQLEYRKLFAAAYPGKSLETFSFADAANALAHFQELTFATRSSRWDSYVRGEAAALTDREKEGAILFFGKGRCSVCHSGPLFSDFSFHSLGIVSERNVADGGDREPPDLGRYCVTGRDQDKYKFRTPPLRNVTRTAPYFHDGSAPDLITAIRQHGLPLARAREYDESGDHLMSLELIESVSEILLVGGLANDREIELVAGFLNSLEDDGLKALRPRRTPSGLAVRFERERTSRR